MSNYQTILQLLDSGVSYAKGYNCRMDEHQGESSTMQAVTYCLDNGDEYQVSNELGMNAKPIFISESAVAPSQKYVEEGLFCQFKSDFSEGVIKWQAGKPEFKIHCFSKIDDDFHKPIIYRKPFKERKLDFVLGQDLYNTCALATFWPVAIQNHSAYSAVRFYYVFELVGLDVCTTFESELALSQHEIMEIQAKYDPSSKLTSTTND